MTDTRANMDADIDAQDVAGLVSADALAGFFQRLGYDTSRRAALAAEAIGIRDADGVFRRLELLSDDSEGFLRVAFAQVRSVTVIPSPSAFLSQPSGTPRGAYILIWSTSSLRTCGGRVSQRPPPPHAEVLCARGAGVAVELPRVEHLR
jgi:hypothetical protein